MRFRMNATLRDSYIATMGFAKADTTILRMLSMIGADDLDDLHRRTQARRELLHRIADSAFEEVEGSGEFWVRVEESGRDCDCVQYSGRVHTILANIKAFDKLYADIAEWADGPFHLRVMFADEQVEYRSRDLVLEAFENGHPHSIHP